MPNKKERPSEESGQLQQRGDNYGACSITSPGDDEEVDVMVPAETGGCAGEFFAAGTATKNGWNLLEARVIGQPGNEPIGESAFQSLGTFTQINGNNWSSSNVITAACEGGDCANGASTVRAIAYWEQFVSAEEINYSQALSGQVNFIGKCTSWQQVKAMPYPVEVRASESYFRRGWHYFTLDPNTPGPGSLLRIGGDDVLGARVVECFVEEVDWQLHGVRGKPIVSCLGQCGSALQPASVRHPTMPLGAVVLTQPASSLAVVISSEDRRRPITVRVSPDAPVYVYPNVRHSIAAPHRGHIRVALRIAD